MSYIPRSVSVLTSVFNTFLINSPLASTKAEHCFRSMYFNDVCRGNGPIFHQGMQFIVSADSLTVRAVGWKPKPWSSHLFSVSFEHVPLWFPVLSLSEMLRKFALRGDI